MTSSPETAKRLPADGHNAWARMVIGPWRGRQRGRSATCWTAGCHQVFGHLTTVGDRFLDAPFHNDDTVADRGLDDVERLLHAYLPAYARLPQITPPALAIQSEEDAEHATVVQLRRRFWSDWDVRSFEHQARPATRPAPAVVITSPRAAGTTMSQSAHSGVSDRPFSPPEYDPSVLPADRQATRSATWRPHPGC